MRFIKYFLFLLFIVGFGMKSFAQGNQPVPPPIPPIIPMDSTARVLPHARPRTTQIQMSPDTLLKRYGDSVRMRMAAGDYEGALKYSDLRIRKTPFRMQFMYYDRAQAETYLGKFDNAIKDYDTVIGLDSSSAAAYMNRAYLLMQVHKNNKAFSDYDKALKLKSDSSLIANIYLSRGNAYLSLKQTKEAETDFTHALTYNPKSWQSWIQRGSIKRFNKDISGALHDLNMAYKLKRNDPDVLLLRGMILYESGMYKETIEDLNEANKFRKNISDSWFYLGMAEMKTGEDSLAREYFTKILDQDPKNALVLNTRGKVNFDMKHPLLAIKDYTRVIELKPKSAEGYANRAFVYTEIGEKDKACVDWHKASSLGMKKANEIIKKYCGK